MNLFSHNFDQLSPDQRERLLTFLASSYETFEDRETGFAIVDILGWKYANESSLQVLADLRHSATRTRDLLPHGLRLHVTNSNDPSVRQSAEEILRQMQADPSEQIRAEVALALARLSHRDPSTTEGSGR